MALILALLPCLPLIEAEPAQASYNFSFPITVQDTSNTSRTYVPVVMSFGGTQLVNAGYTVNGLDTNLQNGAVNVPYMMDTTNVTAVIASLPAGASVPLDLLTGYSPAQTSFPIIVGNGGNITTLQGAWEPSAANSSINVTGYLNATDVGGYILDRDAGAGGYYPRIYVSASGVITAEDSSTGIPLTVSVSGVASGNSTILLSFDGAQITLNVNGTSNSTAAASFFANIMIPTAWNTNNVMPYMASIIVVKGGVEVIHYQPNTMVTGTTLPNLDSGGLYPGTINFGTNDHINIIYGQQVSSQQTSLSSNVTPGFSLPAFPMPQTWFAQGENLQTYGVGFVQVLTGNTTVTATGISMNFTSAMVGKVFTGGVGFATGIDPSGEIIATVPDRYHLTLSVPYPFGSDAHKAYSIEPANPPPFYPLFWDIASQAGIPVQTLYFVIVMPLAFLAALLCIVYTKSALLGVLVMTIFLFMASAATIVPMWIPFSILVIDFGIMYLYRQITY